MAHPLSNNTHVFPFATERSVFPYDHVLNEQNISNMIKTVLDSHNYLIHFNEETRSVKFVINGYYFDTVVPSDISLSSILWVTVSTFKDNKGYQYLSAADSEESAEVAVFTGITFSNSQPSVEYLDTSLKILLDEGNINTAAYLKFDPKSIAGHLNNISLEDDLNMLADADTTHSNSITTLSNNLENEIKNRTDADTTHSNSITTLSNNLATEISNRKTSDNELSIRISTLENRLKWKTY